MRAPLGERYTEKHPAVNVVLKTRTVFFTLNLYTNMALCEEKVRLIEVSNKYLLSIKFIRMYKKFCNRKSIKTKT